MATYLNLTITEAPPGYFDSGCQGQNLVATAGCMILLTTVAIVLRFVSRYISHKVSFWWDDWCALIAWVFLTPMSAFLIDSVTYGVGLHQGNLSPWDIERLNMDIYVGEIFYNFGLTATKCSALFFYIRVFPWTRTWFRWTIYTAFALCGGWCVAITFMGSFQCTPAEKYWKQSVPGSCLDGYKVNLGATVPNVVIDCFILSIPMPFLRDLDVTLKQKIGVAIVFFAGYATLALSITRVVVTAQLTGERLKDYSWNAVTFLEVVDLEPCIGLISVCLPAQVYLFRYFLSEICGLHWSTLTSSMQKSRKNLSVKSKRQSDRVRSMIESAKWRNLSNATSNVSYQAEVYADLDSIAQHAHPNIEGIQVRTDVTVRPSSWAPQFVALILGE